MNVTGFHEFIVTLRKRSSNDPTLLAKSYNRLLSVIATEKKYNVPLMNIPTHKMKLREHGKAS